MEMWWERNVGLGRRHLRSVGVEWRGDDWKGERGEKVQEKGREKRKVGEEGREKGGGGEKGGGAGGGGVWRKPTQCVLPYSGITAVQSVDSYSILHIMFAHKLSQLHGHSVYLFIYT